MLASGAKFLSRVETWRTCGQSKSGMVQPYASHCFAAAVYAWRRLEASRVDSPVCNCWSSAESRQRFQFWPFGAVWLGIWSEAPNGVQLPGSGCQLFEYTLMSKAPVELTPPSRKDAKNGARLRHSFFTEAPRSDHSCWSSCCSLAASPLSQATSMVNSSRRPFFERMPSAPAFQPSSSRSFFACASWRLPLGRVVSAYVL